MVQKMKKPLVFLLAAVLALTLSFTVLPVTAHADTITVGDSAAFETALANAAGGDTIELSADITVSKNRDSMPAIEIFTKNLTIDCKSYTLTIENTADQGTGLSVIDSNVTIVGTCNVSGGLVGLLANNGSTVNVTSATQTGSSGYGVAADGGSHIIVGAGGAHAMVENSFAAFASGTGSQIVVHGAVQGEGYGAYATGGAQVTANSASSTYSTGAYADTGAVVHILQNVTGSIRGVFAYGDGSTVTVDGDASASGYDGVAAYAYDGGHITVAGKATAINPVTSMGAYARGSGSQVSVTGIAQGGTTGVKAENGGQVTAGGAIALKDWSVGVNADGGTAIVNGDVQAKYGGLLTTSSEGSSILVNGDVTSQITGVSFYGGSVKVNGTITAPTVYININDVEKVPSDGVLQTSTNAGYLLYSDASISGTVLVRARMILIGTQPAAATTVVVGRISGSLTCAASVFPKDTLSYQWFSCDDVSKAGPVSAGVTTAAFPIPASLALGTHYYFCRVSAAGQSDADSDVAAVTVVKPAGDYITDIVIHGGTLSPSFDPDVNKYTVALDEYTGSFNVDVIKSVRENKVYMNSRIVTSGRVYDVNPGGKRVITIKVVTPAGRSETYTVTATRAKSTDADLAGLSASFFTYTIKPDFDKDTTMYLLNLPSTRKSIVVKIKADSPYAAVSINGRVSKNRLITLKKGVNIVTIIVKAQAGNMKVYTLTIYRGLTTI